MIFLPSRGRRLSLERFFRESKPVLPGRVLIDDGDDSYSGMALPAGWEFLVGRRCGNVERLNRAQAEFPGEETYGIVADDCVFLTPGWDEILSAAASPCFVAWGDDGKWGGNIFLAGFIGGDLVRAMGWLVAPVFGHLYADKVWHHIADPAGLLAYRPEVVWRHVDVQDATWRHRRIEGDREIYKKIAANGILEGWMRQAVQFERLRQVAGVGS